MAKQNAPFYSFNAGIVSKLALGRLDITKSRVSAETMTNWVPYVLGPMQLRPGLGYIANTNGNAATYPIPFVFSSTDTAIIELGNSLMQVRVSDALVTRNNVSTAVTNGDFSAAASWTLTNTGGGTSSISGGVLTLSAVNPQAFCKCTQTLTIAAGDQNVEHGLNIVVVRGPVGFRIGSSSGGEQLLAHTLLGTGTHSLAFTPTGASAFIQFESSRPYNVIVDSCTIESSGTMTISIPWAAADLPSLNWTQSGDIVYIAAYGYQQRKIERRSTNSWSLVLYETDDGPFGTIFPTSAKLKPSGKKGNITLKASQSLFSTAHSGSLVRLFNTGQVSSGRLSTGGAFVGPIRVTGSSGSQRRFTKASNDAASTWTGTLTLQKSADSSISGWVDVNTDVVPGSTTFLDSAANSVIWYRYGFKDGNYTSGIAGAKLSYSGGGKDGVVRLTTITNSTLANAEVLRRLSSTVPTNDWLLQDWSADAGFPSAVSLFEGRVWWFGLDRMWASVSDQYESYDYNSTGDSATISRSIGQGPVEKINWALPLQRLILGLQASEASVRASDFGTPITPTNFTLKDASTQGSAQNVHAVKVDSRGIFVQQSKRRIYELLYDINTNDYTAADLTELIPDLGADISQVVVQRQPDTRLHFILSDGTVLVLTYEPTQKVIAFWKVDTSAATGVVERAVVLPGTTEDYVYYYVKRTINGSTVRFVEKWALRSECVGGTLNKQLDSFISVSQASSTTITGLSRLEGETVGVWANGKDLGTYTVSGGSITVSEAVTTAIVGLVYTATFKSAKLAYAASAGTPLLQPKRVDHLGVVLQNTHFQGLQFGKDASNLDNLPLVLNGATIAADTIHADQEIELTAFRGSYDTDSRLYLQATAPRPCTIVAAVIGMKTDDVT